MKINVKTLVPKEWIIEKISDNTIKVFYVNKGRGSSPKPFILPNQVTVDKEFIEAIAMYLGDGKLSADDKHLGFCSIDTDMVRFVLNFFMNRFNVQLKDMTVSIKCKEFHEKILVSWSKELSIPKKKFKIQTTARSRNPSCEMQISGKVLRILFGKIVEFILSSNFLEDKILRRSFLRGLFAAEGSLGINRKTNYVVCCQYCLGEHEKILANFIKKALRMEKVLFKECVTKSNHSRIIQITNWKNYHKLWKIDLFTLNKRKELVLLNKIKITRFSCRCSKAFVEHLINKTSGNQRQIALLLGLSPASITNAKNKNDFISVELLINLSRLSHIPIKEVKRNILEFRVNDITRIDDRTFIDFVFDVKKYCI